MKADLARGRASPPAGPFRIAAVARTSEPLGVLAQHLLQRSDAGGQTKAFKYEMPTSSHALSRLGAGGIGETMVACVMALLSFAESAPRA